MNQDRPRYYSIIPAAGKSTRMGVHKLLLPWVGKEDLPIANLEKPTVLDAVLHAWNSSNVDDVVLVLRDDQGSEISRKIQAIATRYCCHPVFLQDPPDMRASILGAMEWLERELIPTEKDYCFISPADLPGMNSALIDTMVDCEKQQGKIVVPLFGRKKGHPALFPWNELTNAKQLPPTQGLDSLIRPENRVFLEFPASNYFSDINTPEDYERLKRGQY